MKVFICSRAQDKHCAEEVVTALIAVSKGEIAILQQTEHSEDWKIKAQRKIRESDFVLFVLGEDTFESDPIKWEYAEAKDLNKQIVGYSSEHTSDKTLLFCEGFQVFDNSADCFSFLTRTRTEDRALLIEQYKIMVSSTEKVTSQRLTVNNLFFTVTSSIVSIALVIGKTLEFSIIAVVGMIVFTLLALLLTSFWTSMVTAYGQLNRGKFMLIDTIEKKLRTDMFDLEWKILRDKLKYKPNTETENNIVKWYRIFIVVMLIVEISYLVWLIYGFQQITIPIDAVKAPQ